MNLFPDEHIITSTDNAVITLTTHRIRSVSSYGWGQSSTTSIMLEKVSSIQAARISYPIMLIIAGVCALWALFAGTQVRLYNRETMIIPMILAIIFVIFYFVTRRQICTISSDGGAKIIFGVDTMTKDGLSNFIDKVEAAKSRRSVYIGTVSEPI